MTGDTYTHDLDRLIDEAGPDMPVPRGIRGKDRFPRRKRGEEPEPLYTPVAGTGLRAALPRRQAYIDSLAGKLRDEKRRERSAVQAMHKLCAEMKAMRSRCPACHRDIEDLRERVERLEAQRGMPRIMGGPWKAGK